MDKVKIFKGVESELEGLEKTINQWMATSGATIVSVTGNIASQTPRAAELAFSQSDVIVIVHYKLNAKA